MDTRSPLRSLYHYRLLLALCDDVGFNLCQEFFWHNPAKMPAPAEWVNVRRIRVKDSVEYIFWLSASAFPKADNSKVLQAYSRDMERLIKRGVKQTKRPSGHNIKPTFSQDRGGSIPANIITCGNNESNSNYIRQSKELGQKVHPARFPAELPRFFIEFLTEPGDVGARPLRWIQHHRVRCGTTGAAWLAIEKDETYAKDSELRFKVSEGNGKANGQALLFEKVD